MDPFSAKKIRKPTADGNKNNSRKNRQGQIKKERHRAPAKQGAEKEVKMEKFRKCKLGRWVLPTRAVDVWQTGESALSLRSPQLVRLQSRVADWAVLHGDTLYDDRLRTGMLHINKPHGDTLHSSTLQVNTQHTDTLPATR